MYENLKFLDLCIILKVISGIFFSFLRGTYQSQFKKKKEVLTYYQEYHNMNTLCSA